MDYLNLISLILGVAALLLALVFLVSALSKKSFCAPVPKHGAVYHEAYASTASMALYAAALLCQICDQWSLIQCADWLALLQHGTSVVVLAVLLPLVLVVNLAMLLLFFRKRSDME